jgi:cellulose synthase/poly-beta-1,6-N-acetylglucosamine synthase-like glycosyltransferase
MMLCLAYIACFFVSVQCANALMNLIFRQKLKNGALISDFKVSVLIPARNEADKIGLLLESLSKMRNVTMEILVFDDQSEDETAQIVVNCGKADKRIRLLQSTGLPKGWSGKNHACYQLAQKATGQVYLFLDADVIIEGDVISDAMAHMKRHQLKLLSVFPKQVLKTLGEKLSVPVMNFILLSLLPLIFVRISPFKSHAAANGQFMMFNADKYNQIQPHLIFKNEVVEDIAIAGYYKKQKINVACLTNEKRIKCRMYESYREAVQGFSKNVFMFFGNKPILAFAFWIVVTLGFIPVSIALPGFLGYYFAVVLFVIIFYALSSRQNLIVSVLFFPVHLIFLLQILINGLRIKQKKQTLWKGRYINS